MISDGQFAFKCPILHTVPVKSTILLLLGVSQNSLSLMVFVVFSLINKLLFYRFKMQNSQLYKFTPGSAVPVVEVCKQMRFLLYVLMGNVNDRYDCLSV